MGRYQLYWELNLAWAAGFIDGEGCIRIVKGSTRKQTDRYYLQLTVVQTELEPLKKMKDMFQCGTIFTVPRKNPKHKPLSTWKVQTRAAENVIKAVLPYLIVKRKQAEVGLKFRELVNSNISRKTRSPETLKQMEIYSLELSAMKRGES